jgi:hypothetical protein
VRSRDISLPPDTEPTVAGAGASALADMSAEPSRKFRYSISRIRKTRVTRQSCNRYTYWPFRVVKTWSLTVNAMTLRANSSVQYTCVSGSSHHLANLVMAGAAFTLERQ